MKRGIRKISIIPSTGKEIVYKIPYGKHVVVHEGDFINAGTPLCEGAISPADILSILGPNAVREYLVNEIQEVYRLQGVGINDKHIEIIVNQMMKKVVISDKGDTKFLPGERLDKSILFDANDKMKGMVVIDESGGSNLEIGIIISRNEAKDLNKELKDKEIQIVGVGDHGISIGVYFLDPDGNEIEAFYELPREEWPDRNNLFSGKFPKGSIEDYSTNSGNPL